MNISEKEFNEIREYIKTHSGNCITDSKKYLIVQRLKQLVIDSGSKTFGEYIGKINNFSLLGEKNKIIEAITTNETSFFRDKVPFEVLKEKILAKVIENAKVNGDSKIKIWSAAASSGQEIYSLAILIYEYCKEENLNFNDFEFIGTDISESMIDRAKKGIYSSIEIKRGLTIIQRDKYFNQIDNYNWEVKSFLKKNIKLKTSNLMHNFSQIPICDIIFCRNVLIYFEKNFQNFILNKIYEQLNRKGYLFIGSMEKNYDELSKYKKENMKNISIFQKQ